jgi:hypothetical protein
VAILGGLSLGEHFRGASFEDRLLKSLGKLKSTVMVEQEICTASSLFFSFFFLLTSTKSGPRYSDRAQVRPVIELQLNNDLHQEMQSMVVISFMR